MYGIASSPVEEETKIRFFRDGFSADRHYIIVLAGITVSGGITIIPDRM